MIKVRVLGLWEHSGNLLPLFLTVWHVFCVGFRGLPLSSSEMQTVLFYWIICLWDSHVSASTVAGVPDK